MNIKGHAIRGTVLTIAALAYPMITGLITGFIPAFDAGNFLMSSLVMIVYFAVLFEFIHVGANKGRW